MQPKAAREVLPFARGEGLCEWTVLVLGSVLRAYRAGDTS